MPLAGKRIKGMKEETAICTASVNHHRATHPVIPTITIIKGEPGSGDGRIQQSMKSKGPRITAQILMGGVVVDSMLIKQEGE